MMRASAGQKKHDTEMQKQLETFSEWVEVLNSNEQVWAIGRRLTWLPADEFGNGASMLIGAINLENTDAGLRAAIEQHCHPVYVDEHLVLAYILARPSRSESLMMGPLNNPILQGKIEAAIVFATNDIDVLAEATSSSIGLMETEKERREFIEIRRKHVQP